LRPLGWVVNVDFADFSCVAACGFGIDAHTFPDIDDFPCLRGEPTSGSQYKNVQTIL